MNGVIIYIVAKIGIMLLFRQWIKHAINQHEKNKFSVKV